MIDAILVAAGRLLLWGVVTYAWVRCSTSRRHRKRAEAARQFLSGTWDYTTDSQPRCEDCGLMVTVGAAAAGHWRCQYCLVIHDFKA
jgi:hypothetical protein